MVRDDQDLLRIWLRNYDVFISDIQVALATELEALIKDDVFNNQGQAVTNTDRFDPRGLNPKWKELSSITKQLKGSDTILEDTRQMVNTIRWQIEPSEWDDKRSVVKVGWFEDSGNRAYIAAIHEFGLTGLRYTAIDGTIMGGDPIGRTEQARAKIRWWYKTETFEKLGDKVTQSGLGMRVSGVVRIPERSMLRKALDMLVPDVKKIVWDTWLIFLDQTIDFLP